MIVSLVSQKGGVGKSCLALAIAWELMSRGERVLLVDTDPQGSTKNQSEKATRAKLVPPTTLSYGANIGEPNQLAVIADRFDHIVIDTPGNFGDITMPVVAMSDVVLIPNGPDFLEFESNEKTAALVASVRRTANPDLRFGFVFNRFSPKLTVLDKSVRKALVNTRVPVFGTGLPARLSWREANSVGQGVAQYSPGEKAAAEVRTLIDELLVFGGERVAEAANG